MRFHFSRSGFLIQSASFDLISGQLMAKMPLERSERMALARDEHRLKTLANHSRLRVVNGYSEPVKNVSAGSYTGLLAGIQLLRQRDGLLLSPSALMKSFDVTSGDVRRGICEIRLQEQLFRIRVSPKDQLVSGAALSCAGLDVYLQLPLNDAGEVLFWGDPSLYSMRVWQSWEDPGTHLENAVITSEKIEE
jgi:hypothetical protein